jgi:hypothetical protein
MDIIDIALLPTSDDDDSLRAKRKPGQAFQTPTVMVNKGNHGGTVRARAVLTKAFTGTITKGGPRGTLLVFEFRFQVPNPRRRFKSAKITLEFEDAQGKGDYVVDPVVHKIVPDGSFSLNRAVTKSNVTKKFSGSLGSGMDGLVEASLGFEWEVSKEVTKEHYTSLAGIPSNEREDEYGEDNAAIWWLAEDDKEENGIPRWMRTAVLLRHTYNRAFLVRLSIETKVDLLTEVGSFFGIGQTEAVDPVNIDPAKLGNSASVEEMEGMDLLNSVDVAFATPIETNHSGFLLGGGRCSVRWKV